MARNPIKASAFTTWLSWLQPFCPIVGRQQWKEQYVTLFSEKPNIFHILLLFYRLQNIPYLRAYDQIWAQKIENNLQRVLCVIVFNIHGKDPMQKLTREREMAKICPEG